MNEEELKKPKAKARPLDDLLSLRGKPFADWKEEKKYLQEKWGTQGRQMETPSNQQDKQTEQSKDESEKS